MKNNHKGACHYRFPVSGKYGIGYCGAWDGLTGHAPPQKTAGFQKKNQRKSLAKQADGIPPKFQKLQAMPFQTHQGNNADL